MRILNFFSYTVLLCLLGISNISYSSCLTAEEILELLVGQLNLPTILEQDIFKRTNPIVIRNIIDSPIVGRTRLHEENACLQAELFYSHIEKAFFTLRSSFIDSIISFDNEALFNLLPLIQRLTGIENLTSLPQSLNILKNLQLQERQTGAMFSASGNYKNWHLEGRIPLYWVEHNFFLTPAEQNALWNTPFFEGQNLSQEEIAQIEAMFQRLLAADRLGIGDTRLKLEQIIYSGPNIDVFGGLSLTLPTSATISRGLVGGKFTKSLRRPEFSISQVIKLLTCPPIQMQEAGQLIGDLLTGAICQLTANIADRGLGNERHFGFAPTIEIYRQISNRMGLELYAAYEFFNARNESRYFIERKNIERLNEITENFENFNEQEAELALAFLNETLINTLYPFVIRTKVRPGSILKITPRVHIFIEKFAAWIGYDFWRQGNETFKGFDTSDELLNRLKIGEGKKQRAEQQKLFFDLRWYTFSSDHAQWEMVFKGDWTIQKLGIGDNFTLAIGMQGIF